MDTSVINCNLIVLIIEALGSGTGQASFDLIITGKQFALAAGSLV